MKKILKSVFAIAIATLAFTSCDDVPQPYGNLTVNTGDYEEAAGEGTQTAPYNVAGVLKYISKLEADVESEQNVYIEGVVSAITEEYTTQYGSGTFDITDEGSTYTFTVFRALYVGNKKFAAGDQQIAVGDKVVVCGKVVKYRGTTPETAQGKAYLVSINGEGGTGGELAPAGEASGDGTLANPYNSVAANNLANGLADNAKSDNVYIKGKVVSIKEQYSTQYGNATFYISDSGTQTDQFYVYRALYLGNKKYAAGDLLKEGDEVIIYGKVMKYVSNYGTTLETSQGDAYLYSLNGKSEGGEVTPQPSGSNLLANGDFESWTNGLPNNWKTTSTAGNATLSQSSDAHGGSYSVVVGMGGTATKRMGYKETTLKAGTYTFKFYAKSTTTDVSQTQAGYCLIANGAVVANSYKYGGYVNLSNTTWTEVSTTFTLDQETTVCLVMMNPKTSNYATSQDILVDDAELLTANGGLADGSGDSGQGGNVSGDVQTVTVAQFLAAAESTSTWYQLTGTISNLKNGDLYGNFDLTDATGTVYVYGVLSEKGGAKKQFQDLVSAHGLKNGSTITIIGNRGSYQGKDEVTNAYFVSASN